MRTHQRDDGTTCVSCGFKRFAVPLHQCGLDRLTVLFAVQHLADGRAVMREIGVQSDKAAIARPVNACGRIPGRRRRLAVDPQIALGTAFDHRVAHVDPNLLRLSAAQAPEVGRSKTGGGDIRLRSSRDTKRRRQLWLFAAERDSGECCRLATGAVPEIGENLAGCFHGGPSGAFASSAKADDPLSVSVRESTGKPQRTGYPLLRI
jgi:hypothetical protein